MAEGHTMTIHNKVAYTTARFNPMETQVINLYGLNAQETRLLKAHRKYEEENQAWLQRWLESDDPMLLDWEGRPKLEDFLTISGHP